MPGNRVYSTKVKSHFAPHLHKTVLLTCYQLETDIGEQFNPSQDMRFTCIQILAKRIHSPSKYTPMYEQLLHAVHDNGGFLNLISCISTEARISDVPWLE